MKTREEDQNKNVKSEKSINGMSHNNVHKKKETKCTTTTAERGETKTFKLFYNCKF